MNTKHTPHATCTHEVAKVIDPSGSLQRAGLLTVVPRKWRVIIDGKDSGIVETNPASFSYWSQQQIKTGHNYRLEEI